MARAMSGGAQNARIDERLLCVTKYMCLRYYLCISEYAREFVTNIIR